MDSCYRSDCSVIGGLFSLVDKLQDTGSGFMNLYRSSCMQCFWLTVFVDKLQKWDRQWNHVIVQAAVSLVDCFR